MSGCGCSFTPVENKETEEIKYTDALAEQFAAEVGVDPRPNETLVEIDERGAFIRQPNAFIQPFGDKEGGLKAEANRFGIYWATGCNWSNRPIIVRELLGLSFFNDTATTEIYTLSLHVALPIWRLLLK